MWRTSEVTLIREIPAARGVGEEPLDQRHTERCTVKSIGMTEHYQARAQGLMEGLKLVLDYAGNYFGEKRCRFEGKYYRIERSYNPETNECELTLYPENGIAVGGVTTDA